MTSVLEQDNLNPVELKPCPFCGDTDLASYTKGGLLGIVECPCGAEMHAEMPELGRNSDGRSCLSEQQVRQLELFRKKHRLATQPEAMALWVRCLAVDAWNARTSTSGKR